MYKTGCSCSGRKMVQTASVIPYLADFHATLVSEGIVEGLGDRQI